MTSTVLFEVPIQYIQKFNVKWQDAVDPFMVDFLFCSRKLIRSEPQFIETILEIRIFCHFSNSNPFGM